VADDLVFDHKWGPGVNPTDYETTGIAGGCDDRCGAGDAPHDHTRLGIETLEY
jgi:hypothetical protein